MDGSGQRFMRFGLVNVCLEPRVGVQRTCSRGGLFGSLDEQTVWSVFRFLV